MCTAKRCVGIACCSTCTLIGLALIIAGAVIPVVVKKIADEAIKKAVVIKKGDEPSTFTGIYTKEDERAKVLRKVWVYNLTNYDDVFNSLTFNTNPAQFEFKRIGPFVFDIRKKRNIVSYNIDETEVTFTEQSYIFEATPPPGITMNTPLRILHPFFNIGLRTPGFRAIAFGFAAMRDLIAITGEANVWEFICFGTKSAYIPKAMLSISQFRNPSAAFRAALTGSLERLVPLPPGYTYPSRFEMAVAMVLGEVAGSCQLFYSNTSLPETDSRCVEFGGLKLILAQAVSLAGAHSLFPIKTARDVCYGFTDEILSSSAGPTTQKINVGSVADSSSSETASKLELDALTNSTLRPYTLFTWKTGLKDISEATKIVQFAGLSKIDYFAPTNPLNFATDSLSLYTLFPEQTANYKSSPDRLSFFTSVLYGRVNIKKRGPVTYRDVETNRYSIGDLSDFRALHDRPQNEYGLYNMNGIVHPISAPFAHPARLLPTEKYLATLGCQTCGSFITTNFTINPGNIKDSEGEYNFVDIEPNVGSPINGKLGFDVFLRIHFPLLLGEPMYNRTFGIRMLPYVRVTEEPLLPDSLFDNLKLLQRARKMKLAFLIPIGVVLLVLGIVIFLLLVLGLYTRLPCFKGQKYTTTQPVYVTAK